MNIDNQATLNFFKFLSEQDMHIKADCAQFQQILKFVCNIFYSDFTECCKNLIGLNHEHIKILMQFYYYCSDNLKI